MKCLLTVKQTLEIAGGIYKRKLGNEAKDTELIFICKYLLVAIYYIVYDDLMAKHKNQKITLRNLEQFLIALNVYWKIDIRIEILKIRIATNRDMTT